MSINDFEEISKDSFKTDSSFEEEEQKTENSDN